MGRLHKFTITIADIAIEVRSELSSLELGIQERLGPFLGNSEEPTARVSLCWRQGGSDLSPRGELIYDPGEIWRMYCDEQSYFAEIRYDEQGSEICGPSVLQANPSWDDLILTEQRKGKWWKSLLCLGAGELILRTNIVLNNGLVFHAAGIDDNGQGILFVGHSGAGKSTQTALWCKVPGAIAMNDDRMAVRLNGSSATCFGTPWGGTENIARNHRAPLSAIVLLEQATDTKILPLSRSASAPLLFSRAFIPYWDRELVRLASENLAGLLDRVPVYLLRFCLEPSAVPLVRSVMS